MYMYVEHVKLKCCINHGNNNYIVHYRKYDVITEYCVVYTCTTCTCISTTIPVDPSQCRFHFCLINLFVITNFPRRSYFRQAVSIKSLGTKLFFKNIAVCKTQMPPFPNIRRVGLTFDLDLWPTDLNVNRDHLLIKDYVPTKFEACGAKRCWVIGCTRFGRLTWPLTLTFDLLTWMSIGIIYSSRTIYLPSFKLAGQTVVDLSVAKGLEDWHDLWPWPLTYWPDYQ